MDQRLVVSIHESGDAVVSIAVGKPADSLCLTENGGGEFREHPVAAWEPRDEQGRKRFRDAVLASYKPTDHDRDEVWPLLLISFGGICAQRRLCGSAAASFEHLGEFDREQREDLAKAITESPDEARQLLNAAQAKAGAIIDHGWPAILRLADALMLRGKLDDHEIRIAVTGGPAWRRRASWDEVVARSRAAARGA
jgi:hypothetical protein